MSGVLQHIVDGRHTASIGRALDLDDLHPVRLVRVRCDRSDHAFAPLLEAKTRVEKLLGTVPAAETDPAAALAARLRPLGDGRETWDVRLVALFNRLRDTSEQPAALLLESVETADEATLELLERMVRSPTWMRLPLVLEFRSPPIDGAGKRLLDAVERVGGVDCVLRATAPSEAPRISDKPPESGGVAALGDLAPDVRRVLRAGAVLGPRFTAESIAELLAAGPEDVLDLLQAARDAGVPIEDDGQGSFRLLDETAEKLRGELLPSVLRAWHRRAAEILGSPGIPAGAPKAEPFSEAIALDPAAHGGPWRAAGHAEAAGDSELAARQYALAARQAVAVGAYAKALAFDRKALELLAGLPPTERLRIARAQVLLDAGRASFMGTGAGGSFSLTEALGLLDACRSLLKPADPVELRSEVAAAIAAVCYDIGEPRALSLALEELAEASKALLDSAHPLAAARLLNDEAAVRVRLGELDHAERLLGRSREIFTNLLPSDVRAAVELAETDHLQARLALHAEPKIVIATGALERALERAHQADIAYASLGMPREQARVWETLGRLERLAGRTEQAARHLSAAFEKQRAGADGIGLARSTAALAELASDEGDWHGALGLLTVSIGLNLEKGSRLGLSVNRDTLEALRLEIGPVNDPELLGRVSELEAALDRVAV